VIATLFGLSETQALVVLFVFLPFALALVIIPLVGWMSRNTPRPVLTSEILANGLEGQAEILAVRNMGTIVDVRPMVRFQLRVMPDAGPGVFDLEVVQAIPRQLVGELRVGDTVEVRLTADHSAGAIVWAGRRPGGW
jgi:hypothetical protein